MSYFKNGTKQNEEIKSFSLELNTNISIFIIYRILSCKLSHLISETILGDNYHFSLDSLVNGFTDEWMNLDLGTCSLWLSSGLLSLSQRHSKQNELSQKYNVFFWLAQFSTYRSSKCSLKSHIFGLFAETECLLS